MSDPATTAGTGDAPPLSRAEIDNAIKSLTADEKAAIVRIAKHFERDFEARDLIQEAYLRILDERRKWPRRIPAPKFFHGVIRSVASEWTEKRKKEVPIEAIDILLAAALIRDLHLQKVAGGCFTDQDDAIGRQFLRG
jgi:DNA-directed RNA polymerase specialized sigma24 family protein